MKQRYSAHPIQHQCNDIRNFVRKEADRIMPFAKDALSDVEYAVLQRSFRQLKSLNPFDQFTGAANAQPLIAKVGRYVQELREQTGE